MFTELRRLASQEILRSAYPEYIKKHPNLTGRSDILIDTFDIMNPEVTRALFVGCSHRMVELPYLPMNIDFPTMFGLYKRMNFRPSYNQEVNTLAQEAESALRGSYDIFIGLPTRKELHTARAVEAIQKNCSDTGVKAAVFVYHNFTNPETEETENDLATVRKMPDVFLWDEHVLSVPDMGNVRGKIADVAMQFAQNQGLTHMIYASADADITRISGAVYKDAITAIHTKGAQLAIARSVSDPLVLATDRTLAIKQLIDESLEQAALLVGEQYLPRIPRGSVTIMDARLLCATGSFPPVSSSEDLLLGFLIKEYLKVENVLPGSQNKLLKPLASTVWIDTAKEIIWKQQGIAYKADWEKLVDSDRPTVPNNPVLDYASLKRILLDGYLGTISRHSVILKESQIEEGVLRLIQTVSRQFLELHGFFFRFNTPEQVGQMDLEKLTRKFLNGAQMGTDKHHRQALNIIDQQYSHLIDRKPQRSITPRV